MTPLPRTGLAVLLVLASTVARSTDEATRLPLTPERIETRVEWFGVYADGVKMGHAVGSLRHADQRYVVELRMEMKVTVLGEQSRMEMRDVSEYSAEPPYRFLAGSVVSSQGLSIRSIRATNGDETLNAVIREGGRERTLTRPAVDLTLADELTPELWIRRGPESGSKLVFRSYSLEALEMDLLTLTVSGVHETTVDGVKTRYYECAVASPDEGEMGTLRLGAEGKLLSWEIGGLLELRSEPEELATKTDYSADLFVMGMVKVDEPLGNPEGVRKLVLEVRGEGSAALHDGPGQRIERGETVTLHIGAPETRPLAATAEQIARALEATVAYPVGEEEIVAMAREAVGDAETDREKVRRLVRYVSDYVEDCLGCDAQSVVDVIDRKAGDCTEHAMLFTVLARAAGIPAREVGGLSYLGDEMRAFGGHAWNEVVLDGHWVPVDPTMNQTRVDATHVRIAAEDERRTDFLRTVGRLEFRVVEIETESEGRPVSDGERSER